MYASVNGVRLFFDVEGAKWVPDGPVLRERFENAGHGVYRDEPERAFTVLREFLSS